MSRHLQESAPQDYEGFVDVQHSDERVSRRVVYGANRLVRFRVHRLPIRADDMDVAAQLVADRAKEMGWPGEFCEGVQ
jgi:hypothetical protein